MKKFTLMNENERTLLSDSTTPLNNWRLKLDKWYYEHPVQAQPSIDNIADYIDDAIIKPLEEQILNLEETIKIIREIEYCKECGFPLTGDDIKRGTHRHC